jgi:ubiquinone/menaquinone biosynthesis C-methylase UbiE
MKKENIWEVKARTQPLGRIIAGIGSEERYLIEDAKQATKILKKKLNLGRKTKVLDIGTGPLARFAIEFARLGCDTIGIDISRTTVKNAKTKVLAYKKRSIRLLIADLNTLPFKDSFFSVVFCAGTFYHIPKKKMINALQEMNRVLKQKGSFISISLPNRIL